MIYYLILGSILLAYILLSADRRYTGLVFGLFLAFLVLFTGLRWETGTDWPHYKEYFDGSVSVDLELGYRLLQRLIHSLGGTYTDLLLALAVLTIWFLSASIQGLRTDRLLSLALCFSAFYLGMPFGAVRQGIAVCICYCCLPVLLERKYWHFLFGVLVACCFHRSAIFFLVVPFLMNRQIGNFAVWVLLLVSVVLGQAHFLGKALNALSTLLPAGEFFNKLWFYANHNSLSIEDFNFGMHFFLSIGRRLGVLIVVMLFRKQAGYENKYFNVLFNLFVFGNVLYFLLAPELPDLGTRLSLYLGFSEIFLIPIVLASIKERNQWVLAFFAFAFYCVLKLSVQLGLQYDSYVPYQSVFGG